MTVANRPPFLAAGMGVHVGHGGGCRLDGDTAGAGEYEIPILAMVKEMNVVNAKIVLLCEKQQNYCDGINKRNFVNNFLSMHHLRMWYYNSANIVLEPSLLTQINMKVVAARRQQECFRTAVPQLQKEVKKSRFDISRYSTSSYMKDPEGWGTHSLPAPSHDNWA